MKDIIVHNGEVAESVYKSFFDSCNFPTDKSLVEIYHDEFRLIVRASDRDIARKMILDVHGNLLLLETLRSAKLQILSLVSPDQEQPQMLVRSYDTVEQVEEEWKLCQLSDPKGHRIKRRVRRLARTALTAAGIAAKL